MKGEKIVKKTKEKMDSLLETIFPLSSKDVTREEKFFFLFKVAKKNKKEEKKEETIKLVYKRRGFDCQRNSKCKLQQRLFFSKKVFFKVDFLSNIVPGNNEISRESLLMERMKQTFMSFIKNKVNNFK